ncbi:hypothetical protein A2U01_0006957, partial [Trifolium medium]|nr:hypothetical protein [Trifolium medium]
MDSIDTAASSSSCLSNPNFTGKPVEQAEKDLCSADIVNYPEKNARKEEKKKIERI